MGEVGPEHIKVHRAEIRDAVSDETLAAALQDEDDLVFRVADCITCSVRRGMPPFYAQQMESENHQPLRVESQTEGPLDITATRSEDGKILVIHVVNTSGATVKGVLALHNFFDRQPELTAYTLSGELKAENTPGHPAAISTVKSSLRAPGDTVEYNFPAHSYTVLRLQK